MGNKVASETSPTPRIMMAIKISVSVIPRLRFWILDFGFWIADLSKPKCAFRQSRSPILESAIPDTQSKIQNPKSKMAMIHCPLLAPC